MDFYALTSLHGQTYICGTFRKLPLTFYASAGTSVNYPCGSGISLNIRQLYVRQRDILSILRSSTGPSINFHQLLSVRGKHFVRKLDLPLNFRQLSVWLRDLPSSFLASAGPSVIFHKHSVRPRDLLSTCVNFSCGCGTYRQLSVHLRDLSPTFRASEGPFINFSYVRGRSINFRQLFVRLRDYPTNICVSAEHCVIFSKHSMRPQGLPSNCVNFPCGLKTFRQLPSTFHAST